MGKSANCQHLNNSYTLNILYPSKISVILHADGVTMSICVFHSDSDVLRGYPLITLLTVSCLKLTNLAGEGVSLDG